MKSLKTILGAIAIATLLGVSFSASAQENNNRDENGNIVRGSYETNRFGDNWFIGLGAGYNAGLYSIDNLAGKGGLATTVNLGKWFTPSVGARIGWRGLTNAALDLDFGTYKQNSALIDLMWNISNAFSGYKETRFWDIIPYAGFGGNWVKLDKNASWDQEFVINAGILNDFRLGKHVDLFLDLQAMMTKAPQYAAAGVENDRYYWPVSATLGLIFNLGRTNFDRHSSITPVVVPVPFTVDQYNALKNRVAELEKENAALRNRIAELESRKPETIYVDNTVPSSATIYFDLGSSKISEREKAHLEYYASTLGNDAKVTVVGSADSGTGTPKINAKLSADRAKAVKDLLVSKFGLSENNINVETALDVFDTPAKSRVVIVK
ncbi:MAG: OmpA family protein [Bacteroidales bacterium]|nr:OmpA family protein [Bacteroidales bacterium]